jgi:hypothetical protein
MFEAVTHSARRSLLRTVRERLVERARRRSSGTFTADDVQALLSQRGYTSDVRSRQSIIATLLNNSMFFNTGYEVPSERPAARGRLISEWTTEELAPLF